MPIQHALWKIGQTPTALAQCMLANEQQLEEMIVAAPEILSAEWMLIGRQGQTADGRPDRSAGDRANVLFFQVFQCGGDRLLSRAWLIDPGETQANVAATTRSTGEAREPWNGEFYVSFGGGRSWEDARKYGFISAGGGSCVQSDAEAALAGGSSVGQDSEERLCRRRPCGRARAAGRQPGRSDA